MPFSGAEFQPSCFYCAVKWSRSVPIFITNCMHTTCGRCSPVPTNKDQMIRCRHCGNRSRLLVINEKAPPAVKALFTSVRPVLRSMIRALGFQRALRRSYINCHERILRRAHEKLAKVEETWSYWQEKVNELESSSEVGVSPNDTNSTHIVPSGRSSSLEGISMRAQMSQQDVCSDLTFTNPNTDSVSPGILKYPPNTPLTGTSSSGSSRKKVTWTDEDSVLDQR